MRHWELVENGSLNRNTLYSFNALRCNTWLPYVFINIRINSRKDPQFPHPLSETHILDFNPIGTAHISTTAIQQNSMFFSTDWYGRKTSMWNLEKNIWAYTSTNRFTFVDFLSLVYTEQLYSCHFIPYYRTTTILFWRPSTDDGKHPVIRHVCNASLHAVGISNKSAITRSAQCINQRLVPHDDM